MGGNYKPIGDYIQLVKEKNKDALITNLLGINIDKFFMPSVANIVGTDLSAYKIVREGQFACNRMHVGRDYRIPIALSSSKEPFIVSPAYSVFEIIDTSVLFPEYLMMWFSRKEFDRNAWFHTDADVRGGLPWELFCELELPIPSIEKQREIVNEYNTIQKRIELNNQLIQNLEDTAQTIYKQWFVEFEFPDENGLPYKSNGGEMVWCEELEKEIPEGWNLVSFSNICEIGSSKRIYEYEYCEKGIPFYRGKEITLKKNGQSIKEPYFISQERYSELVKKYGKPSDGDILLTAVGTIGSSYMVANEDFYFKDGNIIWLKNFKNQFLNFFIYDYMQTDLFNDLIDEITIGSTQSAITITTLNEQKIIIPTITILEKYSTKSRLLNKNRFFKIQENLKLEEFKEFLLARMTKVESGKELVK